MIKKTFAFLVSVVGLFAAMDASAQATTPRRSLLNRNAARQRAASAVAKPDEAADSAATDTAASDSAETDDAKSAPALNWDAAPVDIVLQTYAEQTDKTILKDPATPTPTITLKTRQGQKLTREEYLEAIEVVLEMNGIHLEPYGERFIRALPRKDVRKEGIPLIMNPETKLGDTGRVVSVMIPFKNIGTEEAQKALEGFKSNSGILLVFERTNSILVTDTEQNINRMLEIARSIDIATPVLENVFVRQIKNANAADIKQALEAIVQESQKELEKGGKNANNANASAQSASSAIRPGSRLLNQRGPNGNQPQTPVNNESLVMSVSDADRGMIRGKVLILSDDRSNKLIIVTQKPNMDFFDKVIEQLDVETTPDTVVKVYRLKYAEAEEVSDMINDLIGNTSSSSSKSGQNQNAAAKTGSGGNLSRNTTQPTTAKKPSNQRSGEAKAGELTKDNTTVLADKRINGLVVMTEKELVPTLESIIESMDVKLSQVLIETAIIEVTLGDDLKTGIDWVQRGRTRKQTHTTLDIPTGSYSQRLKGYTQIDDYDAETYPNAKQDGAGNWWNPVYEFVQDTVPVTATSRELVRDGMVNNNNYMLGGGGGGSSDLLSMMMSAGTNVAGSAVWGGANPIGGGINYLFKSDKLNLAAIIQASKTDTRAKYIASPVVMTVDNKEANIEATESRKFYSGSTTTSSSTYPTTSYNYSDKDIGIKIKLTPKINPNGTVMLTIEEEYSQLGAGQTVLVSGTNGNTKQEPIDTALARKMSADVLLDNMQTVVLGGLTETYTSEQESGIPILKDIPWIGKWLFGSVSQSESRKELLVFLTPYVLDDGDSAQAEAIRRKRAISDTRPWDDHGWSLSELADPVSKKEQLRRLKDEWKKQDEERKTKLAIEEEKVKRVKQLEKMSEEERKFWLDMHKDELEKEQRKELEEKMLDEDSQRELKALAEEIRLRKLAEAEEAINKAADESRQENERGQFEAKKAEEVPEAESAPEAEGSPEDQEVAE